MLGMVVTPKTVSMRSASRITILSDMGLYAVYYEREDFRTGAGLFLPIRFLFIEMMNKIWYNMIES